MWIHQKPAHLDVVFSKRNEPRHEISINVVSASSKGSDQSARMRSLIRAFASRLNIQGLRLNNI